MADRIAIMRAGRIVQVGRPADLYYAPADAFVAAFFGEINRLEGRVEGGRVSTPLGELHAGDFADGTLVEILIRPEALRLRPVSADDPNAPPGADSLGTARVMAARLLGRSSLVHLSVDGAGGQNLHLHARVPGRFLPEENEVMAIHLDRSQAFVFAIAEAT